MSDTRALMAIRPATNVARKMATGGSIFDVINIAQIGLRLRRNIYVIRKLSMHRLASVVTAEVAIGRSSSRGDSKSAAEAPSRWIAADCERRVMLLKNNDAAALAQTIVDTIREPLLVLDKDLRVLAASRSFYLTFKVAQEETEDRLLYELGDGQWDVCGLRVLLESIVPEQGVMDDFEVEHLFPKIGRRTMLLNARKVFYEGNSHTTMLLGIEDVTARRALEREREDLLRKQETLLSEKDVLLREMEHRVGNSLQIIAAIILMKSRMVTSEETRLQLQDTHKRVMSVAAVQQYLHVSGAVGPIEMAPYLSKLCDSLKTSMIGDYRPATLKVNSDAGSVTSREAVSLGLIVTELILNALKHAFPDNNKTDRQIAVGFDVAGTDWKLSVADNGIGPPVGGFAQAKTGLGTSIINALAQQLEARVDVLSGAEGTTVSVTHATFAKLH